MERETAAAVSGKASVKTVQVRVYRLGLLIVATRIKGLSWEGGSSPRVEEVCDAKWTD